MATRTTTFPDGRRIGAFRGVEAILTDDPGLIAAGVNFRSWNGSQPDAAEPSSGQCPMIRISPEVIPNDPITQSKSIARFAVKVEIFAAGTIAEDIVNFWDAVEAAMVRARPFRGTTVECFLQQQCGAIRLMVDEPAFGAWKGQQPPDQMLYGVGRIRVSFFTNA